jgi:hypothetical protein
MLDRLFMGQWFAKIAPAWQFQMLAFQSLGLFFLSDRGQLGKGTFKKSVKIDVNSCQSSPSDFGLLSSDLESVSICG